MEKANEYDGEEVGSEAMSRGFPQWQWRSGELTIRISPLGELHCLL